MHQKSALTLLGAGATPIRRRRQLVFLASPDGVLFAEHTAYYLRSSNPFAFQLA